VEDLPYRIELLRNGAGESERILARARTSTLARIIFEAACNEYPGRSLVLIRGTRAIAKREI